MTYFRIHSLATIIFCSLLLAACGGSDENANSSPSGDNSSSGNNSANPYDLVDYLFDESLSVLSSSVSYTVHVYDATNGVESFRYTDKFERTHDDTIYWSSDNIPASTYIITASSIEEIVHSANDELRDSQRHVNVGTEYMNTTVNTVLGTQNATCHVAAHHATVDLSTLTGTYSLATGVYNDVLEVNCITGFVVQGTIAPHTMLVHYFAKGTGIVFTEGQLLGPGEIYMVPAL